jgi:hypothetical protein
MKDPTDSVYFKQVTRLRLWPLLAGNGIIALLLIVHLYIVRAHYIPAVVSPLDGEVSPYIVALIDKAIWKVAFNMGVLVILAVAVNALAIEGLRMAKRFLSDISATDG